MTERDKDLAGFLGITRYLSREQIERLMFPGRVKSRSSIRLGQLTKEVGGQPAILKELGYATNEGWKNVFGLTGYGYLVAQERLGKELLKVPRHDVSPQFLKHSILLSEFFLGLVAQDARHPAKIPQNFRWILGEYLDLPFSEYSHNRNQRRRLQPDAVLEIPSQHARFFIEIETGSATIWDQEKMTSTLAKLNRYSEFLNGYAGNVHRGDSSTFYSRAFPDAWPPEVLFVTLGAHRRDSIQAAQEKWRFGRGREDTLVRAMTLEEATKFLFGNIHGGARGGTEHLRSPAEKPLARPKDVPTPANNEQEERLRPGRVAVRGEELIRLEAFLRLAHTAIAAMKTQLIAAKLPVPPAPDVGALGHTWQIYAARARRALAAFGIKEAVD